MRAAGLIRHADRLPVLRKRIHDRTGADRGGWSHGALRRLPRHLLRRGRAGADRGGARRDRGVPRLPGAAADRLAGGRRAARGRGRERAIRARRRVCPARLRLPSIPLAALARLAAMPKAPVLALILVGLVGGAVLGRERIVAAAPATARLHAAAHLTVNPLGLDLKGVRSELVLNGQDQLLVVEGEILNRRGRDIEVPSLRLTVRGPDGLEL